MIYLDSAATSMQKPQSVQAAMRRALGTMASPGRGSHRPAMLAADEVFKCRELLASLFNVSEPEHIVFTMNATHALNIAISSLIKKDSRVVISGYEHNSVTRPLKAFGADVEVAASPLFEPDAAAQAFERALPGADFAVCCHVSNAFGYILPVERIARLCRLNSVPLIIDASQSAGVLEIDAEALGARFIAMPGHKGLLGPQGTGVLIALAEDARPLMYGGTGSDSKLQNMPDFFPDRLEAGTHNITGIAGLYAGARHVMSLKTERIRKHEQMLLKYMVNEIKDIPGIRLYNSELPEVQSGVLSVTVEGISCESIAGALGDRGVAVRAGMHCSPLAHKTAGTLDGGTIRFSFSPFNTPAEVYNACRIFRDVVKKM